MVARAARPACRAITCTATIASRIARPGCGACSVSTPRPPAAQACTRSGRLADMAKRAARKPPPGGRGKRWLAVAGLVLVGGLMVAFAASRLRAGRPALAGAIVNGTPLAPDFSLPDHR